MEPRAVLAAALLLATALAGCAESGDSGPVKIVSKPADGKTDPVVVEATVAADSYEWDMGDGRAKLTGKRVEHVYGVTDGAFTIKLTTTSGGQRVTHDPVRLELGTGVNAAPAYELAAEWQWVQVGEEVSLSGAGSTDPEGDTLLFSWYCQRKGDVMLAGAGHAHGGGGGVPYGTGNANLIPFKVLNGTAVPAADHTVAGDLCADIPAGFQEGATIRGKFAQAGLYEVTMLAKDPAHPAVPGTVAIYVTESPRAAANETYPFDGTLQHGAPAEMDAALEGANAAGHLARHAFTLKYPTLEVRFRLSDDGGAGVPVDIGYSVRKGTTLRVDETSQETVKGPGELTPGEYTATVALRQGAEVGYDFVVDVRYETDPAKIFEGIH